MPAPPEAVDTLVRSTVEDHARRQSAVAYTAAFLFFVNAGLSDEDLARWTAAYLPWQRQVIIEAATRGWSYSSLLWALQTDNAPEGLAAALEQTSLVSDILRRSEQYADRPVIRARWEASKIKQVEQPPPFRGVARPTPPPSTGRVGDVRPEVRRARQAAQQSGLLPTPTRKDSTFSDSMERGAARAAEQAMAETNEAFGSGMDEFSSQPGKLVTRYLKVPNANACSFCFLVSTRGYRTASSAMSAGHRSCKCGAKAIYVLPRQNRQKGQSDVSNWYWGEELNRQGYGLLYQALNADEAGRTAILSELLLNEGLDVPTRQ